MPSIFLSYARDDDEPFVKRLYQDLISHGFEVWWDRVSMPSRQLTFHQEIRDAIKVSDRVVLVVGPHAVTSDYVNQEWQWALEMGKCINPIIRLNGQQECGGLLDGYALLPEQLKLVHAEDFRDDSSYKDHLVNFERQLKDPVPPLGKLVAVPTLPAHYRAQPERLRQLRDVLLVDLQKPIVISGAVARVGVQGMGGIGKSVLAAALARDPEVRRAFPDGIFWIGLGQHPNLIEIQRQIVKLLEGDQVFEDTQSGKTRLRELLEHRAVLLILDDVWQSTDTDAFDVVDGLRSKLLLTTRDAGLVTSFTGISYQVQLPSTSEACALLAAAARILVEALPPIAEEIIDECGRLPLALALCGSMASKGQTWERILRMLREARLELIADRQEINEMHRSIWRAMEASVSILTPIEQRRFTELAVFSFDTKVPEEAVFTLWYHTGGLDNLAASDLLVSFYERSLVQIDHTTGSTGSRDAQVSLHDLLFDFATRSVIKNFSDIAVLHNQLLDSYWQKCLDGWPSGPDDGYFLQHLCQHLSAANKQDQLVPLLVNFTWIERKVDASLLYSLIDDYNHVTIPEGSSSGVFGSPYPSQDYKNSLSLIQGALRLSSHLLAQKPHQLPSQLVGRLLGIEDPVVRKFVNLIKQVDRYPWLHPIIPSLTHPGGPLIRTLTGHAGPVIAVAVTPDGCRAVTASSDESMKVWDLESGKVLHTLTGHPGRIHEVLVTPNGHRFLSRGMNGDLKIWDLESGQLLHNLTNFTAVTPDHRHAVTASRDITRIWDLETCSELASLVGHINDVNSVAVTHDGRRAVSWGKDGTLMVWDLERGQVLHTLIGNISSIESVAMTPDGHWAAVWGSNSWDQILSVWDLESCKEFHTRIGDSSEKVKAISPDGRRAVTISGGKIRGDNSLNVWDLVNGWIRRTIKVDQNHYIIVAITPDLRVAITGSRNKILKVWDLESGRELGTLAGHFSEVTDIAVTPDGRRAVSGSLDKTLKVWDLYGNLELATHHNDHSEKSLGLATTKDKKQAVFGSKDKFLDVWRLESGRELPILAHLNGIILAVAVTPGRHRAISTTVATGDIFTSREMKVWDLESGRELHTLIGHTEEVIAVAITPDGKRAVSGSDDRTLKVWDLESGRELHNLTCQSKIFAVAVTPDGRHAVSISYRILEIWDLENGIGLHTFIGNSGYVSAVTVTPDGRYAVCGSDKMLEVWDLESGREFHSLKGHTDYVSAVTVTPDGRRVVSGSNDGTLKIWDLESGKELKTYAGHTDIVMVVAITPDGKRAVSGSNDGTLKVWDLESGSMIAEFHFEERISRCVYLDMLGCINVVDAGGRIYKLRLERVTSGYPVTTAMKLEDGSVQLQCFYCQKWSDLKFADLGREVACTQCGKKMQVNFFSYKENPFK